MHNSPSWNRLFTGWTYYIQNSKLLTFVHIYTLTPRASAPPPLQQFDSRKFGSASSGRLVEPEAHVRSAPSASELLLWRRDSSAAAGAGDGDGDGDVRSFDAFLDLLLSSDRFCTTPSICCNPAAAFCWPPVPAVSSRSCFFDFPAASASSVSCPRMPGGRPMPDDARRGERPQQW